jgi:hypothetical protein
MKKTFDSVGMMRKIREKMSAKYVCNPSLEQQELHEAKARFERKVASKRVRVAENGLAYGNIE